MTLMGPPPTKRQKLQDLVAAKKNSNKHTTEVFAQNAITLSFYQSQNPNPENNQPFFESHPKFTHQIFEKEVIRGYWDPKVILGYNVCSLNSWLEFEKGGIVDDGFLEVLERGGGGGEEEEDESEEEVGGKVEQENEEKEKEEKRGEGENGEASHVDSVLEEEKPVEKSNLAEMEKIEEKDRVGEGGDIDEESKVAVKDNVVKQSKQTVADEMEVVEVKHSENDESKTVENVKIGEKRKAECIEPVQKGTVTDVIGRINRFRTAGLLNSFQELEQDLTENLKLPVSKETLVTSYTSKKAGKEPFRIYRERLSTNSELQQFHKSLQFLMFLHIDGASYIDDQDPRWELFLIFGPQNEFIAYATVYPFLTAAGGNLKEGFRERIRISQVFVLPPYQGQGHGRHLLQAIYNNAKERNALEITVEDPSEDFRRLRDGLDLALCYKEGILMDDRTRIAADAISEKAIAQMRQKLLLTAAQARRIMEIHCCRAVPWTSAELLEEDYEALDLQKRFRLMVKRRLFRDYEEVLSIYDREEKKEKLADIYSDYETAYRQVAERFNAR